MRWDKNDKPQRLKGITADKYNKDPDLSARVALDIPDVLPLSFLFRSGCATLSLIEKLVGFEKTHPHSHQT